MKLCLAIITKNEEIHLERLLKNVKKIVNAVYIVDSYSKIKLLKLQKNTNVKYLKEILITFQIKEIIVFQKYQKNLTGSCS